MPSFITVRHPPRYCIKPKLPHFRYVRKARLVLVPKFFFPQGCISPQPFDDNHSPGREQFLESPQSALGVPIEVKDPGGIMRGAVVRV